MTDNAYVDISINHRAETAAQHLVRDVPSASPEEPIGVVLARLSGHSYAAVGTVYVVDQAGRLHGLARLVDLLSQPPERTLAAVMLVSPSSVYADEDQEQVASIAIQHQMAEVPVCDREGHFLGVVPPLALIEILRREHVEDLQRFTGIMRGNSHARGALEAPAIRRARDRLPWLLVGLLGSMVATLVVARFERALQSDVTIAFFIPGLVYLADAIGTQSEAVAVRGLSFSNAPLRVLLAGELKAGLLIGITLGALILPTVWLVFGDMRLALAVALALPAAGAVASSIGLFLPWLLSQAGKDPALGSGPVATIIQDVLSLLIYFIGISLLV
ncbi:MAG: magnesium transporter [Candidatus Binatia bacterium]